MNADTAVLLMAYGAASSLEDIPAYLEDIRGGRPADDKLVAEVRERYRRIGGSPLLDITRAQASALQRKLGCRVYVGMRHSPPTILEAARKMKQEGVRQVVAMPLTPYFSALSSGAYFASLDRAARELGAGWRTAKVESWHLQPSLIEAFGLKIQEALRRIPQSERANVAVLFTAHSLPRRILKDNDPYPRQLSETVAAVARRAGLSDWRFAYQSQGRTPEPWLGPEAGEILEQIASEGRKGVVLAPIGFISDHMETLYDDDILYRGKAEELGLRYVRAASLNDDPGLVAAMAAAILEKMKGTFARARSY